MQATNIEMVSSECRLLYASSSPAMAKTWNGFWIMHLSLREHHSILEQKMSHELITLPLPSQFFCCLTCPLGRLCETDLSSLRFWRFWQSSDIYSIHCLHLLDLSWTILNCPYFTVTFLILLSPSSVTLSCVTKYSHLWKEWYEKEHKQIFP